MRLMTQLVVIINSEEEPRPRQQYMYLAISGVNGAENSHFWGRWSREYLTALCEFHHATGNNIQTARVGNVEWTNTLRAPPPPRMSRIVNCYCYLLLYSYLLAHCCNIIHIRDCNSLRSIISVNKCGSFVLDLPYMCLYICYRVTL